MPADRKTSGIWRYFARDDETCHARCSACKHILSYKTSSSNLRKHLKRRHPDLYVKVEERQRTGVVDSDDDGGHSSEGENRTAQSRLVDYLQAVNEEEKVEHEQKKVTRPYVSRVVPMKRKRFSSPPSRALERFDRSVDDSPVGDEIDLFVRSIACQMRQLPLHVALELQSEILNLVIQKRIAVLREREQAKKPVVTEVTIIPDADQALQPSSEACVTVENASHINASHINASHIICYEAHPAITQEESAE